MISPWNLKAGGCRNIASTGRRTPGDVRWGRCLGVPRRGMIIPSLALRAFCGIHETGLMTDSVTDYLNLREQRCYGHTWALSRNAAEKPDRSSRSTSPSSLMSAWTQESLLPYAGPPQQASN